VGRQIKQGKERVDIGTKRQMRGQRRMEKVIRQLTAVEMLTDTDDNTITGT
jgi:hypothetical protein